MLGQILVVTSGKGGVGKTTTTANIGAALAALGHQVLLIDADIGLRNLDVVLGVENRIVYDLVQVIEGVCIPRKAMIRDKTFDNLHLIPAAQTRDKNAITGQQMRELCQRLKLEFDYILIDCPAGIEQGFRNAVEPADKAIVVTTPEVSAVRDADRVIGLIEAQGLPSPGLVLNRVRNHMVRSGDMMATEDVLSLLSVNLLGLVPEDERIIVSTNRGVPVVHDQKSYAGEAFRRIAARLAGHEVPVMELEVRDGIFSRLKRLVGLDGRVGARA
jgi:septum site-determining protein MinD